MKTVLIASCLVMGCAGPMTMEQRAARLDSQSLCYIAYAGTLSEIQTAKPELARRGFNCTEHDIRSGQINITARDQARQQQAADQAAIGAALIMNSRPPAPVITPMPQSNCTTRIINGVAYTNCY